MAETVSSPLPDLAAVIHIGATSVSLLIGARSKDKGFEKQEYLDRPLPLARDIFRTGSVSRGTVEQAAAVLRDFQQSLNENGVAPEAVRCVTTNILSEAANHEIFINRMQVAGGRSVELLDDGDMTRLIYQIALRLLKSQPQIAEGNTLVSHIGPGNTRALYFRKGRIAAYNSYRLGIFRTREAVGSEEGARHLSHIEEQIRGVVEQLTADYSHFQDTEYHVAIGAEIQCAAPQIVGPEHGASFIELEKLDAFTKKLAGMSADEVVRTLHLHYTGGEGMVAALQTNLALARSFDDKVLVVPEGDFQRDLLLDILSSNPTTRTFQDEVFQAARVIARKYHTDRPHAEHVAAFAQQLFRELKDLHGLDEKYELLLRVAAIVHEVGLFVSPREHHKHSLYLILNSEIFGLSTNDRVLVALLARYHRRYNPNPNHPHFSDLTREERLTVLKLASILRLADALDRSHSQRIKKIQSRREGETLFVETTGVEDTTVEQIAINGKSDLFEDIYGYEIVLRAA
jgi:exopolyphosphatase/guanosine-5'-triphosphate,3'-diphosphate pyrophosphatase